MCIVSQGPFNGIDETFQLKRHFEKEHPSYKGKDVSYFERKAESVKKPVQPFKVKWLNRFIQLTSGLLFCTTLSMGRRREMSSPG